MYPRQWSDRQKQAPPRKRRLVTYTMQPLDEKPGHRFGVNRLLRVGEDSLLSAGRDGVVRRWDVSSMLARGGGGGGGRGLAARRRDDGSDGEGEQDPHLQPPCTGVFASHTDWVTGLAVAEDRIMASASYDGTLKLWDLAAADRDSVAAGSADGGAAVAAAEERAGVGGSKSGGEGAAGRVIHDYQGAAASAGTTNAPPLRPNPLATVAGHGDYVKCLAYAEQGRVLVSGGLDKRILLWDLQRMSAPLMALHTGGDAGLAGGCGGAGSPSWGEEEAGGGRATNKAMVDDDYSHASGGEGHWARLRDPSRVALRPGHAATGPHEVLELCRQNKGSVYCVDAAADATLVASGGTDRMIRLLDPRAGGGSAAKICKLDGHGDNVRCVRIDEGSNRVVSGSSDGTIRVWDVRQQCCLGVYELPGGSVWAMQPSPCDFDVYYSGGRGRRVYRTDFRTGESTLVCMSNSEVLDMALEIDQAGRGGGHGGGAVGNGREGGMLMWISSTEPHITLWGGEARSGGVALRAGRPAAVVATAAEAGPAATAATAAAAMPKATSLVGNATRNPSSAAAAEIGLDVDDTTPAFADGQTAVEGGLYNGGCLLEAPMGTILGQPGVMRCKILNNRRHVLTEDDARPQPNVALWDVTRARQVEVYPAGTVLEEKERSLLEIIAVRPWFTVDTHLGTPLVSLSETTVFDGELYAVDARGERQTFLIAPPAPLMPPTPVTGDSTVATTESEKLRHAPSSSSTLSLPQGGGGAGAGAKIQEGAATRRAAGAGTGTAATTVGATRASTGRSAVQDEVKVNLGDAALRGLFARWVDQHVRLHGDGAPPPSGSRRRDAAAAAGSTYSSGESDEDSEDDDDYESRSTSTRSGQSSQASPGPRDGSGSTGGVGYRGRRHAWDVDSVAGGGLVGLGERGGGGAGRAIGDETMLWVTESDIGGHGGIQRTLLHKRVGEFDGKEGPDAIPPWVMACVLHGEFRAKEQPKVAFFLAPWIPPERQSLSSSVSQQQQQHGKKGGGSGVVGNGGGRPASLRARQEASAAGGVGGGKAGAGASVAGGTPPGRASQRFTAPAQMLVSKVMAYVLSHEDLHQHLEYTVVRPEGTGGFDCDGIAGGEGAGGPTRQTPEDLVEVLCGDRVVEPHLYIGAIQQYIWNPKESGTLFLHYRSRQRPIVER